MMHASMISPFIHGIGADGHFLFVNIGFKEKNIRRTILFFMHPIKNSWGSRLYPATDEELICKMFGGLACCFYSYDIFHQHSENKQTNNCFRTFVTQHRTAIAPLWITQYQKKKKKKKTVHKKYINTVHWKRKSNDACSWIIGTSLNRNELNYNKNISNGFYFLSVFVVHFFDSQSH